MHKDDEIREINWHLDEDGGGEAHVFVDYKSHIDQHKYVFDSLDREDQIPEGIAAAIREDGRIEGKIPPPPS